MKWQKSWMLIGAFLLSTSFQIPAAYAELTVVDAVEAYVYLPGSSEATPVFVGDTIPDDAVIYIANSSGGLVLQGAGGTTVKFDKPGFFSTDGAPTTATPEIEAAVEDAVAEQNLSTSGEASFSESTQEAQAESAESQTFEDPETETGTASSPNT